MNKKSDSTGNCSRFQLKMKNFSFFQIFQPAQLVQLVMVLQHVPVLQLMQLLMVLQLVNVLQISNLMLMKQLVQVSLIELLPQGGCIVMIHIYIFGPINREIGWSLYSIKEAIYIHLFYQKCLRNLWRAPIMHLCSLKGCNTAIG